MQALDVLEVAPRHDAAVVDEQPGPQLVAAEQAHQVLQRAGIVHVAVEDLVEQGEAFGLGDSQTNLDQGSPLHLFFGVAGFGQRTVAAIQVGIGDIIDDPGGAEPILAADPCKEPLLPRLRVQRVTAQEAITAKHTKDAKSAQHAPDALFSPFACFAYFAVHSGAPE